jgi:hypothetical protein
MNYEQIKDKLVNQLTISPINQLPINQFPLYFPSFPKSDLLF